MTDITSMTPAPPSQYLAFGLEINSLPLSHSFLTTYYTFS